MSAEPIAPKIGKNMMIVAWVIAMGLLVWMFGSWEDHQLNPNSVPLSAKTANGAEVTLMSNRQGHYVTSGSINQKPVVFLVDTGATTVAIPGALQQELGLVAGRAYSSITANGTARAYSTVVQQLKIGDIELFNVQASILPGMQGTKILLGMSVLREIEFTQKGDTLTLRQEF